MKEEGLRLFVALNVDRSARRQIVTLQEQIFGEEQRGKTRPENLHLTLAFLGETDPGRVDDLKLVMDRSDAKPPKLVFDRIGVFRREGGDIWWLGMEDNQSLQALQSKLCNELKRAGFPVEARKFVAHLTLARKAKPRWLPEQSRLERPIMSRVLSISLMHSHRVGGQLVYTELYRTP